ncbi:hypothetical protein LINGRAHAP2_LOCUS27893 [Linum grandiflorum]
MILGAVFSIFLHIDLIRQHCHYPIIDFSSKTVIKIFGTLEKKINQLIFSNVLI